MTDEDYINKRNKLIPEAVRYVDKINGKQPEDNNNEIWAMKWNRTFHMKMNRLAKESKLTNWRKIRER